MFYLLATVVLSLAACLVLAVLTGAAWIQRLRIEREIQRREEDSGRLYEFLHDLSELFGTEARERVVHRAILGGAKDVLNADRGALYRIESGRRGVRRLVPLLLDQGLPPLVQVNKTEDKPLDEQALASLRLLSGEAWGEGLLGGSLDRDKPLLVTDLGQRPELDGYPARMRDDWSVILAPMRVADSTIGLLVLARIPGSGVFTERDRELAQSVAEQSAYALQSTATHAAAAERKTLRAELQRAAVVQQVLVPQVLPNPLGWKLALRARPARILSGDFHDLSFNGHTILTVADVCGKGLGSALLGAMTRSSLRLATENHSDLAQAASRVNRRLYPDIREDMHVTLVMVTPEEDGSIEVLRAGHEAPLIFRSETGEVEEIVPPGLSLGIDPGDVFERITATKSEQLKSKDLLVIYTDGVTESQNSQGEEFGPHRLEQQLRMNGHLGAEGFLQALDEAHKDFIGDQPAMDDITLVVLEKE